MRLATAAAHTAVGTRAQDPCAPALEATSWMKTRRPALVRAVPLGCHAPAALGLTATPSLGLGSFLSLCCSACLGSAGAAGAKDEIQQHSPEGCRVPASLMATGHACGMLLWCVPVACSCVCVRARACVCTYVCIHMRKRGAHVSVAVCMIVRSMQVIVYRFTHDRAGLCIGPYTGCAWIVAVGLWERVHPWCQ